MKHDEKKTPQWELTDPKPPVIQSGHLENRRAADLQADTIGQSDVM